MIHSEIASYNGYLLLNSKIDNIGSYCDYLLENPKINDPKPSDLSYVSRMKRLINVIKDVGNTLEYGTPLKTTKLDTNDQLLIYKNIGPFFHQKDLPVRAKYSDILLLMSRKNTPSILNSLPEEIVHHILNLKNQLGFMSYPTLSKHYNK